LVLVVMLVVLFVMQPGDAAVMIPAARAATMMKLRLMGFIILIISFLFHLSHRKSS
jgi:hypothetical protein